MSYLTVSETAREIGEGVKPRDISDLFYARALRDDLAPLVGGRRMIPRDYVETVRAALRRAGKLSIGQKAEASHVA